MCVRACDGEREKERNGLVEFREREEEEEEE